MKKVCRFFATAVVLAVVLGFAVSCATSPGARGGNFTNGVFEGTAIGYNGPLSVRVTVQSGRIASIVMFDHRETPIIYTAAETGVVTAIINSQSTNVDTVAGATLTSNAIIQAVNQALGL